MNQLPAFGQLLKVRKEVAEDEGILDMINLAHLGARPKRGLAAKVPGQDQLGDPDRFYGLTYPTEDIQQTLSTLGARVEAPEDVPGTILLSGRYGAGKSHVLLAAHHALTSPNTVKEWAKRWNLTAPALPDVAIVITQSFIQKSTENLWNVLFDGVGKSELNDEVDRYPDGDMIERALGDRPVFLILDELERWFHALDEERQNRNLNFIQALSEVSMRDGRLTLLTSVLGERQEPAETIRRTKPLELAFRSSEDRLRVLQFRLFDDYENVKRTAVQKVVSDYADVYRKANIEGVDEYASRFEQTYPFSPEFIDILIKKVPNLGGLQNTRGTLRFLSIIVRHTMKERPVITSQDLPFEDNQIAVTLRNLDTTGGDIVRRALGDNYETVPDDLKHKRELFSTIVFYSIADPAHPGATEQEIMQAALDPGENPNVLRDNLKQIRSLAYNLHQEGDRFVFKTKENPYARINAVARSPQVTDSACQSLIAESLGKRWGSDSNTAMYEGDVEQTRSRLRDLGKRRPKFVLSTRSISPKKRLEIQNLEERRNLVILVEPKVQKNRDDGYFNLLADDELIRHARQIEACNRLLESKPEKEAEGIYQSVKQKELGKLNAGIAHRYGNYIRWNRAGATGADVDESWYEIEPIEEFASYRFLDQFKRDFSSPHEIQSRVRTIWKDYEHRQASQLIDLFDKTPGEPLPYERDMVPAALRALAKSGVLGLQNEDGKTYSKNVDRLASTDLPNCALVEAPKTPPTPTPPPDETYPTHDAASASWHDEFEGVRVDWKYPDELEGSDLRTLVQRYAHSKGWEEGKPYPMDLDSTHGANRYIGGGENFVDAENLTRGAWYYYYVFLVRDQSGATPEVVLSKKVDIRIPSIETQLPPDVLEVSAQNGRSDLITEVERAVMTHKSVSSATRFRKLEVDIRHAKHSALDKLFEDVGTSGKLDVFGNLTVKVHGEFTRTELIKATQQLPDMRDAVFTARMYIQSDEVEGD